jgi:uncharacterized protein (TIGR03435 family)
MLPTTLCVTLVVFTAAGAFGQTAGAAPAFEVASIRVSQIGKAGGEGSRRENIQVSPGTVTMRNVSLRSGIRWAYHVFDYQVTGPDWLGSERFDIVGKSAGPVAEDQLRVMLQALLAERFKLALHHETKEFKAYVLLVGKNGPKFHETQTEGEVSIQPNQARMSVAIQRAPVSQLAEMLSNLLRAPVLDQTGLKGRYDITIDVAKYVAEFGGKHGEGAAAEAPPDPLSIVTMALQEELGLKLESRKMPLDLLIVDHADKAPVEN